MGGPFGALTGEAGVGTRGGSQDQTAILCCAAGELAQYAWRPVRHERSVPLPPAWAFVIAVSGVAAEKTGGALEQYNRLARAVEGPVKRWPAGRREQFDQECALIPAVADAIARGDVKALGPLVDRSQALAEQNLGNQVPETIALARTARDLGAIAASAFGAGFGGSVWALVASQGEVEGFRARWAGRYRVAFPEAAERSSFLVTRPGKGLTRL
jgi:galactokinase